MENWGHMSRNGGHRIWTQTSSFQTPHYTLPPTEDHLRQESQAKARAWNTHLQKAVCFSAGLEPKLCLGKWRITGQITDYRDYGAFKGELWQGEQEDRTEGHYNMPGERISAVRNKTDKWGLRNKTGLQNVEEECAGVQDLGCMH